MACPCEVLVETADAVEAEAAIAAARDEALRIEQKFSRYRADNIVHEINHAAGRPVEVDEETAALLDYAAECFELSGGLFDITSGVLRAAWKFDGGEHAPSEPVIQQAIRNVGWHRVCWERPRFSMPAGMEIDFGGFGKEYAVDRAAAAVAGLAQCPFLVNFGGDLFASGPRSGGRAWGVGIDDPGRTGKAALYRLELESGGLATSGDARRFVLHEGKRLGHILDPRTGWPVEDAPRSVTVLARTCLEAGTISTLGILQGRGAREFLEAQGVQFWILGEPG